MDDLGLHDATLPVLRHYLGRLDAIVAGASEADPARRLADDVSPAGPPFRTARNFAPRAVAVVPGRGVPQPGDAGGTRAILAARSDEIRALLAPLGPADFAGAAARRIRHRAGEGEVGPDGADYATRCALPNFFLHLVTGYATLRAGGVALGKADVDGLHVCAPGFRF
jgi:hypothetical protein